MSASKEQVMLAVNDAAALDVHDMNLDPYGLDKYDHIMEKYNRMLSLNLESEHSIMDTNTSFVQGVSDLASSKVGCHELYDAEACVSDRRIKLLVSGSNCEVSVHSLKGEPEQDVAPLSKPDPPELEIVHVASRDDLASTKYAHAMHSRDVNVPNRYDPRSSVHSKLEMLNAKSRAFKTFLEQGGSVKGEHSSFDDATVSGNIIGHDEIGNGRHFGNVSEQSEINSRRTTFDERSEIDSRLEFLTKRICEIRQTSSQQVPESELNTISTIKLDKKGVKFSEFGILHDNSGKNKSILLNKSAPTGGKVLSMDKLDLKNSSAREELTFKDNDVLEVENSRRREAFAGSIEKSKPKMTAPQKALALKILSEKVLSGCTITRDHCGRCTMPLLMYQDKTACVYCPVANLRSSIRSGVAKKVMSARVLEGHTLHHGDLCESCHSAKMIKGDKVVCEVCPILDSTALEVVREESRGGMMQETLCVGCGCHKMKSSAGIESCVVCVFLKGKLGKWYVPSQEAKEANNEFRVIENVRFSPSLKSGGSCDTTMIQNGRATMGIGGLFDWGINDAGRTAGAGTNTVAVTSMALRTTVSPEPEQLREMANPVVPIVETFSTLQIPAVRTHMKTADVPGSILQQYAQTQPEVSKSEEAPVKNPGIAPMPNKVTTNMASLLAELSEEMEKAKQCQFNLDKSIANPPEAIISDTGSSKKQKELDVEMKRAKQCQAALEYTISNSPKAPIPDIGIPEDNVAEIEPELAQSLSISQQEVEGGVAKEYIPPKTYFFNKGIPSEVTVNHLPDDSVAQSYHTNHLKNTEKSQTIRVTDCFGFSREKSTAATEVKDADEDEDGRFDYDTIHTDEYTVDYTLNTLDESRMEPVHLPQQDASMMSSVKRDDQGESTSKGICSFFKCFSCGCGDDTNSIVVEEVNLLDRQRCHQNMHQEGQHGHRHSRRLSNDDSFLLPVGESDSVMFGTSTQRIPMSEMKWEEQDSMHSHRHANDDSDCSTVSEYEQRRFGAAVHLTKRGVHAKEQERRHPHQLVRDDSYLLTENESDPMPSVAVAQLAPKSILRTEGHKRGRAGRSAVGDWELQAEDESSSGAFYNDVRRYAETQQAREHGKLSTNQNRRSIENHPSDDWDESYSVAVDSVEGPGKFQRVQLSDTTCLPNSNARRGTPTRRGKLDKMRVLMEECDLAEETDKYSIPIDLMVSQVESALSDRKVHMDQLLQRLDRTNRVAGI